MSRAPIHTWADALARLDLEQSDLVVAFTAGEGTTPLGDLDQGKGRSVAGRAKVLSEAFGYLSTLFDQQAKRDNVERRGW